MSTNLLEDSPALGKSRWNPKVACTVALVLVFSAGGALGALTMDFVVHGQHRPAFETPGGKALYFERLQKELDLTPAQSEQMESILNDFWHYYRSVLNESKVRVEQVLNEQQRQKFERLLQENPKR
jgi:hypothetical protein